MVRKTQKNLRLPIDLVDRLEDEDNQSETAEVALREYFEKQGG